MRNFMTLYSAELKKILVKKAIWLMLIIGLLFIGMVQLSNILFETYKYTEDDEGISGAEFEAFQRKKGEEMTGLKMDDEFYRKVREDLLKFNEEHGGELKNIVTYGNSEEAWIWYAADKLGYEWLINKEFRAIGTKNRMDVFLNGTAEEIQEYKKANIMSWMDDDNMTEGEIDYWEKEYDKIEKPFTYSYAQGYGMFFDALFIMVWLAFMIIVVGASGVFADENQLRTDVLILSSRKGRKDICYAKLLAGITFSAMIMLIIVGVELILPLAAWGTAGWNTPVQNVIIGSAYNITIGQTVLRAIGTAELIAVLCGLFTMFLSHAFRSTVPVMAVQTGLLVVGMFAIPHKFRMLSRIWDLRPTNFLQGSTFEDQRLFSVPGGYFNLFQMAVTVYVLISIVLFITTLLRYRRTQVKSR